MDELAEVWCSRCDQPATDPDGLCDLHRRTPNVPDAIVDPWLRSQYAQAVIDPAVRASQREEARLENVAYFTHEQSHDVTRLDCRWCRKVARPSHPLTVGVSR